MYLPKWLSFLFRLWPAEHDVADPMPTNSLDAARVVTKSRKDLLGPVELAGQSSPSHASERTAEPENNSDCAGISGSRSKKRHTPSLLMLLPLEIRRKIWDDVLGGSAYHLGLKYGPVISGWPCSSEDSRTCDGFDCYKLRTQVKNTNRMSLSILLTCKLICSEALEYLYSSRAFIMADADIIAYLPFIALRQSITSLTTLYLIYTSKTQQLPPIAYVDDPQPHQKYETSRWIGIWRNLSKMQNLRKLQVRLAVKGTAWDGVNAERATRLLEPIRAGTWPDDFTLVIPFATIEEKMPRFNYGGSAADDWQGVDLWDTLPCTVRRVLDQNYHPKSVMGIWWNS